MSKNVIIQEGGVAKSLTADKLKTDLIGGGTCNWVPEDETQLITKSVTKNGTYKASSDGAYGYSKVIVNVAGGSVTGKGSDGNTHTYSVDDQENIVDEVIPDTIEVTTPPTNPYGIYQNGQTIATEGMVVKAYNADETEYGTVPLDEITINPTTAVYDASTDTGGATSTETDINISPMPNPFCFSRQSMLHIYRPYSRWAYLTLQFSTAVSAVAVVIGGEETIVFASGSNYTWGRASDEAEYPNVDNMGDTVLQTTINNKTVYFSSYNADIRDEIDVPHENSGGYIDPGKVAWAMIYGTHTEQPAGSHQSITVTWPRPGDGAELTTTFEILVAPGYTPGDNTEL